MSPKTIVAVILIAIGIVTFAYQGITYTTKEEHEIGPLEVTVKETKHIPLPPIVGAITLVGGIVLLIMEIKKA